MKLIERIEQLLQSNNLDDVLIAISISYNLPFEEFDTFFDRIVPTEDLPHMDKLYYFLRNNKIYFMGAYLGRSKTEFDTFEQFSKNSDLTRYIDLTPDNYETSK